MSVHVNKTRRDNLLLCIDTPPGGTCQPADGGNASIFNGDISIKPWVARAVNNSAVGDEDIIGLREGGERRKANKDKT